jgi:hypothetical protein
VLARVTKAVPPISPLVALVPITAQGVMPPPAAPSMELTPPVSNNLPVSAIAWVPHSPKTESARVFLKFFMVFRLRWLKGDGGLQDAARKTLHSFQYAAVLKLDSKNLKNYPAIAPSTSTAALAAYLEHELLAFSPSSRRITYIKRYLFNS